MDNKKYRELKVVEQAGYHYKPTPTIILKGQWLKDFGFEIGEKVAIMCEHNQLVISKK